MPLQLAPKLQAEKAAGAYEGSMGYATEEGDHVLHKVGAACCHASMKSARGETPVTPGIYRSRALPLPRRQGGRVLL